MLSGPRALCVMAHIDELARQTPSTFRWHRTCSLCNVNHADSEVSRSVGLFARARIRTIVLILGGTGASYLCWLMVRPFLAVITWAAALAILAHPLHAWLDRRTRPNTAAVISVFLVAALIVAPTALVSQLLFAELSETLHALGTDLGQKNLQAKLQHYPAILNFWEWAQTELDIEQQIQTAAGAVARSISAWVSVSLWFLTQLVLTFLTLFYFFRDGPNLLRSFRKLIPLSSIETDEILGRIAKTVNTSLYKNLLVKFIQGFLGGLMFWFLGLPAPVLFGAAMSLLAILPVMGTAIVWLPAAIALALSGSWMKALVLAAWGGLVVSLIDNFLYPILLADDLRLHPLAVFFAVFGGLLAFGLAGVVLGPVILAVAVALLELWQFRATDPV